MSYNISVLNTFDIIAIISTLFSIYTHAIPYFKAKHVIFFSKIK